MALHTSPTDLISSLNNRINFFSTFQTQSDDNQKKLSFYRLWFALSNEFYL